MTSYLERYQEKIEELNDNILVKKEDIEKIKIQKFQIKIDEIILDNKENIIELQKGLEKYISSLNDLPKLEENLKREKESLKELLNEIGPNWDEKRLYQFDISIPTKELVRKKHNTITKIKERIRDCQNEYKRIDKEINKIEARKKMLEDSKPMIPTIMDMKELKHQRKSLQLMRAKYPSLKEKENDMKNLQEKEDLLTVLKPHHPNIQPKLPLWPTLLLITIGVVSLIISIFENNFILGMVLFVILAAASIIYYISIKKIQPKDISGDSDQESENLIKRYRGISERREKLIIELQGIKSEMLSYAKMCGFRGIPDPQLIENKDAELQTIYTNLSKLNELNSQLKAQIQEIKELQKEKNEYKNKIDTLKVNEDKALKEWEEWLSKKGLEPGITPEGIIDIFSTIKTGLEKKKTIDDLIIRIQATQGFNEKYESRAISISEKPKKKKINALVEVEKLNDKLNQNLEDLKLLEQLNIERAKLKLELENLGKKVDELQEKVIKLIAEGHAESESEFQQNAKNWEESQNLMMSIVQAEQNIKKISGDGKPFHDFTKELGEITIEILQQNQSNLDSEFGEIEDVLSELRENLGRISTEIKQIEHREEGSSLRIERAVIQEKLRKKAEEWSIRILAKTILRKAIEKYEKERQPEVIKEARSFFKEITSGKYTQIYAPLDEANIYVEDKDGSRKDIQELSRGTAEQLYLSLRFGFIREFNKRAENLPIIFDDILVNFDPKRLKAACKSIKRLSKTNQIFYFTCHPETVDVLTKNISGTKIIDIGGVKLS